MSANIQHSSASSQWYTPPEIIEVVRRIVGPIGLDPASCARANQVVQAAEYFDGTNADGLTYNWHAFGGLFFNPPYAKADGGPAGLWVERAVAELRAERYPKAIGLVNAEPGRAWFRPLWEFTVAFLDSRIQLLEPTEQFLERLRKAKGWPAWSPVVLADPELRADLAKKHGREEEFPGLVRGPQPTHANALVCLTKDRRVEELFVSTLAGSATIIPAGTAVRARAR